jgi:septum formation protein
VDELRLVLASASPARLATLRAAGVEPEVMVSGVDEDAVSAESPAALAQELAGQKCRAVAARLSASAPPATPPATPPASSVAVAPGQSPAGGPTLVLGCDSVLELAGEPYGKPAGPKEARARWRRMRGHSGVLHTGHALVRLDTGIEVGATGSTVVHFAEVDDEEIDAYVATGEPLGVAGAFTLDGLGGAFVRGVEGDPHTVVGLSLPLLRELVRELGVRWTDLWR